MVDHCRICRLTYVASEPDDRAVHRQTHKKMASGSMPREVRDFAKAFGWAVAHNDGGIDQLKDRYNSELGRLVVVYSWWSRARTNGAAEKDFDAFMETHLAYADALVSGKNIGETGAAIKRWEKYAG